MLREPFADSRVRLQWAKESLTDFERCAKVYFKRTPYELCVEPAPDGVHERHKFRIHKSLPSALTKFTVHAIEDLRAALDLAACDVARLVRPHGSSVEDIYFPFSKSAADFKSRINSACKELPADITKLFASYEPYSGGSDLLFAIKELSNASKHDLIVPVASVIGANLPYLETSRVTLPIQICESAYDSCKNEITFAITERGLQWKYQARFSFGICFGKVGAIEGRDVRANLDGMIRAVTMIVNETEAESRRLNLIH
jgi:hypothetical protein